MKSAYAPFVERMIDRYEGGYGWNKKDPGGPTNFGITCFDLAEHRHQKMTSMQAWVNPVRTMTREEAEAIYADKYADKIAFNLLNDGPDVEAMDYAVNSGWTRPIRVFRAVLKVPGPVEMTPDLIAAINKADPNWLIDQMSAERLHFMHGIRGGSAWGEFGKGWGARVADLRQYAHALANKAPAARPDWNEALVPTQKVVHGDPTLSTKTTTNTAITAAGTSAAASATGIPLWMIGVAAGVVVVGGIAYTVYKHRQHDVANATVVLPGVTHV